MDDIEFETRYATKDVAEKLGVEAVTVRKYAMALEKAGYRINRNGKDRSYTTQDVMAFQYMQSIRSQTSITVEEAAALATHKKNAATDDGASIVRTKDEALYSRYDMLFSMVQQLLVAQQAAPSKEEIRTERLNYKLTERKIERQLEQEAYETWSAKPECERMRRTGLFRKEEDIAARDRFVRDYIDDHYKERMKRELDIE